MGSHFEAGGVVLVGVVKENAHGRANTSGGRVHEGSGLEPYASEVSRGHHGGGTVRRSLIRGERMEWTQFGVLMAFLLWFAGMVYWMLADIRNYLRADLLQVHAQLGLIAERCKPIDTIANNTYRIYQDQGRRPWK